MAAVLAAYAAVCALQLWHFRRTLSRRAFEPLGRRLDELAADVGRMILDSQRLKVALFSPRYFHPHRC